MLEITLEASIIWFHFALTIIVRTHFLHACLGRDCLPMTLYNYFTPRSMPELISFPWSKKKKKKEWSQRKEENKTRRKSLYSMTLKCTAVAQIAKLEIPNNQASQSARCALLQCTLLWQVRSPHTLQTVRSFSFLWGLILFLSDQHETL